MNIPSNLKYTSDHEWIRVEGNEAYVGITDFAQSELGEIHIGGRSALALHKIVHNLPVILCF